MSFARRRKYLRSGSVEEYNTRELPAIRSASSAERKLADRELDGSSEVLLKD